MVIGIDLDEVLCPTLSYHCRFLNEKYASKGLNLSPCDFHAYEFDTVYGATKEQATIDWLQFCQTHGFRDMNPFPDAFPILQRLRELRPLHVITSRQNSLREQTLSWINKYFSGIFSKVNFGNLYSFDGEVIRKLDLCRRNGVELLVEDDTRHAIEVAREIPVVLFTKTWNIGFIETGNVVRAKTWEEIEEKIKSLFIQSSQS